MSTTTIRLSEKLEAAESTDTAAHSFILEAKGEETEAAERHSDFHREAEQRYAKVIATGKTIPWERTREYLQAHAADQTPSAPLAGKLAR